MTLRPRRPAVLAAVPLAMALTTTLAVHHKAHASASPWSDCYTAILPPGGDLPRTRRPDMPGSPLRFYMRYCPQGPRNATHHPLW
ncbi:MAG TPA: hypothetical protein VHJ17_16855 [Thermomonospora sp.]|nr:hypothetical protein [Thermomonospora sp.]